MPAIRHTPFKLLQAALVLCFLGTPSAEAHILRCGSYLLRGVGIGATRYDAKTVAALAALDANLPTLVVIDGLSSGGGYADRARKLFPGIQVIHVQTARRIAPGLLDSFNPKAYDVNLVFSIKKLGHLAQLLERFKNAGLRVVSGTETSPKVQALLTNALGLPGTSLQNVDALTNKYLAAKAVSPYVKTILGETFSNPTEAWEWAKSQNFQFPIMVKPVDAAGSFGVTACKSKDAFFEAFALLRRENPLGLRSHSMLVQPYFSPEEFTEYAIDVVVDPETGITLADVLEYKKKEEDGKVSYLTTRLVHLQVGSPFYEACLEFATGVAKGLAVRDGVLHIEAFVRKGSSPPEMYFIEAGARPAGGGLPPFVRACGGNDMISLHLYSLFDRAKYLELIKTPVRFQSHGVQIALLGPTQSGIALGIPNKEEFKNHIPAFHSHSLHIQPGKWLGPGKDLFEFPGVIFAVGSLAEVDASEQAVRAWEADNFYQLRKPTLVERLRRRLKL